MQLETEDDGPVDEAGVGPQDIVLVMVQTRCTREIAVRSLKANGGDLVNASELKHLFHTSCTIHFLAAVMELTM